MKRFLSFFRATAKPFLLAALSLIIVTGCEKDDDTTPAGNQVDMFLYTDASGVMVALNTVTYTEVMGTVVPTPFNTATAVFMDQAGSGPFAAAGKVSLNTRELSRQGNNAYVYNNALDPLSFNQIQWAVEGSGAIPAINKSLSRGMPSFSGYASLPQSIDRSAGLSLSLGGQVSNADSLLVSIVQGGKFVEKMVAGNASSVSFSASELGSLSSGSNGMLQLSPFNITTETISGKKYYFINQTTHTRTGISIQ